MSRYTLFVVLLFCSVPLLSAEKKPLPNVLFILVDDMGYGELGSYGQRTLQTPRLDQLADEGMRFTRFYAGSTVCAPSRSVLMTGLHTGHTQVRGNDRERAALGQTLRDEDLTIAEVMKEAGYRTALVGKWGLGAVDSSGAPNKQGFDSYYGFVNQTHAHNHFPSFLIRDGVKEELPNDLVKVGEIDGVGYSENKEVYANNLFFEEAESIIRESRDEPFFLYLALTIPHANNESSDELGDGMEVPTYGAFANKEWPDFHKGHAWMNDRIDRGVGELMDLLEELDLADDTIVVFTSDNGPHNEGGFGYNPEFFDANGPLNGIKRDLTDGGVKVPLIIRWPKVVEGGSVSDHVSFFGDFMPTIVELTKRDEVETDGLSLLPVLSGQKTFPSHAFLYWEFYGAPKSQAVLLEGRWKGIRVVGEEAMRLFDLDADPGEFRDRSADYPDIVERIEKLMTEQHEPNAAWSLDL
ncbi:arylsulfatase [Pelagicoccus albus]|uniref:Arylsulfatase n=1 Tax=Pelagicoccus albus TaxID=415222 RepID=A0A7X1E6Z2_9BACT|nr:arylsulfatase [Pelagicoccus albus]MBC2604789.1 arylsulfatase [Pelagicoccus albus]